MIIENDPFALIEAMTIAGVTTGCTKGWIYIRGEYVTATKRLQSAIKQAYENGFLGANALNGAFTFDIELRQGAGAYICGEETALFNSIEGFRGEPRSKPPFPTDQGLFGCPTIVNNPETLINVLEIVNYGVDSFRSVGTADSPGTKLFCLSGDVAQPGLYEAAFGLPLNELLNTAGVRVGDVPAVLLGGAACSFLGPPGLALPLSLEDTAARGATPRTPRSSRSGGASRPLFSPSTATTAHGGTVTIGRRRKSRTGRGGASPKPRLENPHWPR